LGEGGGGWGFAGVALGGGGGFFFFFFFFLDFHMLVCKIQSICSCAIGSPGTHDYKSTDCKI